MPFIESSILGIIQGIAEWLPVSSEGFLVLAQVNLFGSLKPFEDLVKVSLFLHMGTFFAALVYFRRDVRILLQTLFGWKRGTDEARSLVKFLLVATAISGILGMFILFTIGNLWEEISVTGKIITFSIGVLLLITGYLQLKVKQDGLRVAKELNLRDAIILGLVQGFAVLPGLSRSGLTVSALLLRKIDNAHALRISFLMSLPIVLAGNIILNFSNISFSFSALVGLFFSFLFGMVTIHWLLGFAKKINFGYFVLFFGFLTILSVFI